ncbi:MarR family transcriptional regulator [Pseudomaricurvus alkylphenolicus]|jgi:DNA-binding MarR family transcriptional regulator|uniref:MarR family winged helix-turn-helix transcriptional regulator n=1 Tax=Pseudomaricurvus alkylphenolicus TaxID=1306991 RepID=UPI0014213881|nr:MarR family transcriptional regulator [Pseudomaricurvus alkylphenolicus]NIB41002.1 MarR family transcriptional regulator [Pseudomaricurvus alkylphenolicus]
MTSNTDRTLILDRFIAYRMVNLAKWMSDSCSEIYTDEFGLTIAEWRILARLAEHEQLNARDIGEITFMDKTKVSRGVKLLDSKGYLNKEKSEEDSRVTFLSLTDSGREVYHEIVPKALNWESRLLKALDVTEYRDLVMILDKLEKQLSVIDDG